MGEPSGSVEKLSRDCGVPALLKSEDIQDRGVKISKSGESDLGLLVGDMEMRSAELGISASASPNWSAIYSLSFA